MSLNIHKNKKFASKVSSKNFFFFNFFFKKKKKVMKAKSTLKVLGTWIAQGSRRQKEQAQVKQHADM
jgi:hypothetical protein